jgi:hypothetical protein
MRLVNEDAGHVSDGFEGQPVISSQPNFAIGPRTPENRQKPYGGPEEVAIEGTKIGK